MAKKKLAAEESIRLLDEMLTERRSKYRAFVETLADLPTVPRAEAWLGYLTGSLRETGDEEASVYFLNRGMADRANVDGVIADWKKSEQWSVERASRDSVIWTPGKRPKKRIKGISKRDAADVLSQSSAMLPNFWDRDHYNEWYIDATMLRTVEWGEIGGFDDWWKRLANEEQEAAIGGGTEPVAASYWVFAMSRSAYACQLMRRPLMRHLEGMAFSADGKFPWLRYQFFEKMPRLTAHLGYAAHLAFAATVIPDSGIERSLVESAAEALVKSQNSDGSWHQWEGLERPSTFTTAAAIHALAVVDVRGGKRAMARAASWLDSVQSPEGPWNGPEPIADPTFPTVLVLDAKNLSEGKTVTTATTIISGTRSAARQTASNRRYRVALSFSGQVRTKVETVANYLARKLTKDRVFYDSFHQGDLARLNLDTYLQDIYHNDSDLLVVYVSKGYEEGQWPQLEWRAIRDIIKQRRADEVVIVRDDDTPLPGLLSIDGYIDSRTHTDDAIGELILHRLRTLK